MTYFLRVVWAVVLRGLVPPVYIFRAVLHRFMEPYGHGQFLATNVFIILALKGVNKGSFEMSGWRSAAQISIIRRCGLKWSRSTEKMRGRHRKSL